MKNKISFRHSSGHGINRKFGIHSKFLDTLLTGNKRSYDRNLKLPKPYNYAELSMLAKFIFGVELTFNFDQFNDNLGRLLKRYSNESTIEDRKFIRFFKLYKLNPERLDYISEVNIPRHICTRNKKMVLMSLRYVCEQRHDSYYDYRMSVELFNSGYELDSTFWRHCIGKLNCGGIGGTSYGNVDITSLKEYDRLLNMYNNTNKEVRDSFKNKIDKLIEEDKKYDNEKSLEM